MWRHVYHVRQWEIDQTQQHFTCGSGLQRHGWGCISILPVFLRENVAYRGWCTIKVARGHQNVSDNHSDDHHETPTTFGAYGLPQQIITDNGPQFTSPKFSEFLHSSGVKHILVSPFHPSSNGLADRFVKTFNGSMKAGILPVPHRIASVLFTYQSMPHATTFRAPSQLFLRRYLRTRLHFLHPQCEQQVTNQQAGQKANYDRLMRQRELLPCQKVLVGIIAMGPDGFQEWSSNS